MTEPNYAEVADELASAARIFAACAEELRAGKVTKWSPALFDDLDNAHGWLDSAMQALGYQPTRYEA